MVDARLVYSGGCRGELRVVCGCFWSTVVDARVLCVCVTTVVLVCRSVLPDDVPVCGGFWFTVVVSPVGTSLCSDSRQVSLQWWYQFLG